MSDLDNKTIYLEFSEGKSHKFYEVKIQNNELHIRFGRIGDKGQIKMEIFDSSEQAKQKAEKKINEKKNKGYKIAVLGKTPKKEIEREAKPSFEEQLENLALCGIKILPKFQSDILLAENEVDYYLEEPYLNLLLELGNELEITENEWSYLSNNIWHFDTECIEDDGSYVSIAKRLRDLAEGDLPLQNITDRIEQFDEPNFAWLEFELHEQKYHWNLEIDTDWVDTNIFALFDELLEKSKSSKRFTYFDLGGQDCLIGCSNSENLEKLKQITKLKFKWLCS